MKKNSGSVKKKFLSEINKMSFEDSISRLEEIVEALSSQKVNLESMIELYEEGNAIKNHCAKRLEEAKMKIELVSVNSQKKKNLDQNNQN